MTDEERAKLRAITHAAYDLYCTAGRLTYDKGSLADLEAAFDRLLALRWQSMDSAPRDGRAILVIDDTAPAPQAGMAWFVNGHWSGDDPENGRGPDEGVVT